MTFIYIWSGIVCASLLVIISIIKLYFQKRRTFFSTASVFLVMGLLGILFLTFGVYSYLPELDVNKRINSRISELENIKNKLETRVKQITKEIIEIDEKNRTQIDKILEYSEKLSSFDFKVVANHTEIVSCIRLIQQLKLNKERLQSIRNEIIKKTETLSLTTTNARTDLFEWETRGGTDWDVESFILEKNLNSSLQQYEGVNKIEKPSINTKPLDVVWNEILNELPSKK